MPFSRKQNYCRDRIFVERLSHFFENLDKYTQKPNRNSDGLEKILTLPFDHHTTTVVFLMILNKRGM
jgi:hypothetical protein